MKTEYMIQSLRHRTNRKSSEKSRYEGILPWSSAKLIENFFNKLKCHTVYPSTTNPGSATWPSPKTLYKIIKLKETFRKKLKESNENMYYRNSIW